MGQHEPGGFPMKAFWLALLCFLPLAALADVYEWVDDKGRTVYSDTPRPGARRVPLPDFQPVPPPPPLENLPRENTPAEAPAPGIASLRIVSPADGETIHDNSGTVPVEWAVEPAAAAQGAGFRLTVDGQALPDLQTGQSFTLQGVERGEHTVQVTAVDPNGRPLAASATVTFYLWQASQLFRPLPK